LIRYFTDPHCDPNPKTLIRSVSVEILPPEVVEVANVTAVVVKFALLTVSMMNTSTPFAVALPESDEETKRR
jgi:hypothetical protein